MKKRQAQAGARLRIEAGTFRRTHCEGALRLDLAVEIYRRRA
jgi:hypothetical protein